MSPTPIRLMLATPPIEDPEAYGPVLDAALAAGDVAAVVVRLAPTDERTATKRAKALVAAVQDAEAAALIEGHLDIVPRAGADGCHLVAADEPALKAAGAKLKPERVFGAGHLRTRHDAMTAGELGADYVLFGDAGRDGRLPPLEAVVEQVAWWAQLFEIPCAAVAADARAAAELAAAGADFLLVELGAASAAEAAAGVAAIAAIAAEPEAVR